MKKRLDTFLNQNNVEQNLTSNSTANVPSIKATNDAIAKLDYKKKYTVLSTNGVVGYDTIKAAFGTRTRDTILINTNYDIINSAILSVGASVYGSSSTIELRETYQTVAGGDTYNGSFTTQEYCSINDIQIVPSDYYSDEPQPNQAYIVSIVNNADVIPKPEQCSSYYNCVLGYTLRTATTRGAYALYNTVVRDINSTDSPFPLIVYLFGSSRITGTITGDVRIVYMNKPNAFTATVAKKQYIINNQTYYINGKHYKWNGVDSQMSAFDALDSNWEILVGGAGVLVEQNLTSNSTTSVPSIAAVKVVENKLGIKVDRFSTIYQGQTKSFTSASEAVQTLLDGTDFLMRGEISQPISIGSFKNLYINATSAYFPLSSDITIGNSESTTGLNTVFEGGNIATRFAYVTSKSTEKNVLLIKELSLHSYAKLDFYLTKQSTSIDEITFLRTKIIKTKFGGSGLNYSSLFNFIGATWKGDRPLKLVLQDCDIDASFVQYTFGGYLPAGSKIYLRGTTNIIHGYAGAIDLKNATSNGPGGDYSGTNISYSISDIIVDERAQPPVSTINESNIVHRTGDELIAGRKTFTGAFSVVTNSGNDGDTAFRVVVNDTFAGIQSTKINVSDDFVLGLNTDGGKVGVGTKTPSEKFEVNGNVKAVQFIGDGSRLTNIPTVTVEQNLSSNSTTSVPSIKATLDANKTKVAKYSINGTEYSNAYTATQALVDRNTFVIRGDVLEQIIIPNKDLSIDAYSATFGSFSNLILSSGGLSTPLKISISGGNMATGMSVNPSRTSTTKNVVTITDMIISNSFKFDVYLNEVVANGLTDEITFIRLKGIKTNPGGGGLNYSAMFNFQGATWRGDRPLKIIFQDCDIVNQANTAFGGFLPQGSKIVLRGTTTITSVNGGNLTNIQSINTTRNGDDYNGDKTKYTDSDLIVDERPQLAIASKTIVGSLQLGRGLRNSTTNPKIVSTTAMEYVGEILYDFSVGVISFVSRGRAAAFKGYSEITLDSEAITTQEGLITSIRNVDPIKNLGVYLYNFDDPNNSIYITTLAVGEYIWFRSSAASVITYEIVMRGSINAYTSQTPSTIKSSVIAGTYTYGELQGTQPANSLPGMRFCDQTYKYDYMNGMNDTDGTTYVWIRTLKAQ